MMRQASSLLALGTLAACLLGGCFNPSLSGSGSFRCNQTGECPPDFVCSAAKLCVAKEGNSTDSATPKPDTATPKPDTGTPPDELGVPGDGPKADLPRTPQFVCTEDKSFAMALASSLKAIRRVVGTQFGAVFDPRANAIHLAFGVNTALNGARLASISRSPSATSFTLAAHLEVALDVERVDLAMFSDATGKRRPAILFDMLAADPNNGARVIKLIKFAGSAAIRPTVIAIDRGMFSGKLALAARGLGDFAVVYQKQTDAAKGKPRAHYVRVTEPGGARTPVAIPLPPGFDESGHEATLLYRPKVSDASEAFVLFHVLRGNGVSHVYLNEIAITGGALEATLIANRAGHVRPDDDALSFAFTGTATEPSGILVFPDQPSSGTPKLSPFLVTLGGPTGQNLDAAIVLPEGPADNEMGRPAIAATDGSQGIIALSKGGKLMFSARPSATAPWNAWRVLGDPLTQTSTKIVAHTSNGASVYDIYYRIKDDIQQRRFRCQMSAP